MITYTEYAEAHKRAVSSHRSRMMGLIDANIIERAKGSGILPLCLRVDTLLGDAPRIVLDSLVNEYTASGWDVAVGMVWIEFGKPDRVTCV